VARVLESLRPLHALLAQADEPIEIVARLSVLAAEKASAQEISVALAAAITDATLAPAALTHAGVITADGRVCESAVARLAQLQVLAEMAEAEHWELVLTVPDFLRPVENAVVDRYGVAARSRPTRIAVAEIAASACSTLVIAAPYLQTVYLETLSHSVERVLRASGEVLIVTRALTSRSPDPSPANTAAIAALRSNVDGAPGRLRISTWEGEGLGVHFKAVVADAERAYLGSANLTQGGMGAHAEAGVLLRGKRVRELDRWVAAVAVELDRRNSASPH
jgi:hypothetical protein